MQPHFRISNGTLKLNDPRYEGETVDERLQSLGIYWQGHRTPSTLNGTVLIADHPSPFWPTPLLPGHVVCDEDYGLYLFHAVRNRKEVLVLYDMFAGNTRARNRWEVVSFTRARHLPRRHIIFRGFNTLREASDAMYPDDALMIPTKLGRWRGYSIHGPYLNNNEAACGNLLDPQNELLREFLKEPTDGDVVIDPRTPLVDALCSELTRRFWGKLGADRAAFPLKIKVSRIAHTQIGPFVTVMIADSPHDIIDGQPWSDAHLTGIIVVSAQLRHDEIRALERRMAT